jgi:3'-phosphoadenosine 5'-phosphosulfate (PAPS) 3'-phosphatase
VRTKDQRQERARRLVLAFVRAPCAAPLKFGVIAAGEADLYPRLGTLSRPVN